MPWYAYALVSALAIALVGVFQKRTLQSEHTSEYVALFGILKFIIFMIVAGPGIEWSIPPDRLRILILDAVIGAGAFFFVAKAVRRLDVSLVFPLLALDAGVTAVLAWGFLGELLTGRQLLGLALLVAGAVLLEVRHTLKKTPGKESSLWSRGGVYAVLGLLLFSISSTMDRNLLTTIPTTTFLGYVLGIQCVVFLLLFRAWGAHLTIFRPGRRHLLWFVLLAAGMHLLSNAAQATATSLAAVGLVIAIKRLSGLFSVIAGGAVFHEHGLVRKAFASAIMLIGVYFVVQ